MRVSSCLARFKGPPRAARFRAGIEHRKIIMISGSNGINGNGRVRLTTGSAPLLPLLAAREQPGFINRPRTPAGPILPLPARARALVYTDRRWSSCMFDVWVGREFRWFDDCWGEAIARIKACCFS